MWAPQGKPGQKTQLKGSQRLAFVGSPTAKQCPKSLHWNGGGGGPSPPSDVSLDVKELDASVCGDTELGWVCDPKLDGVCDPMLDGVCNPTLDGVCNPTLDGVCDPMLGRVNEESSMDLVSSVNRDDAVNYKSPTVREVAR